MLNSIVDRTIQKEKTEWPKSYKIGCNYVLDPYDGMKRYLVQFIGNCVVKNKSKQNEVSGEGGGEVGGEGGREGI